MKNSFWVLIPLLFLFLCHVSAATGVNNELSWSLVKRGERKTLFSNEYGEISAVQLLSDGIKGSYVLNFFTLEPNSLLLPLISHARMVFYVQTGSGRLSWMSDDDDLKRVDLRPGDVYTLPEGAIFFVHSNLEASQRNKLRINAILTNSGAREESFSWPYTSISDAVLGFDRKVLQAAFKFSDEVMEELLGVIRPPEIVHSGGKEEEEKKKKKPLWRMVDEIPLVESLVMANKKKAKASEKAFNVLKEDKDFVNENGWSTTVTRKKLSALKSSNIGVFMVYLTAGSMMGPHWNPTASEIIVVVEGRGMVTVSGGKRSLRFEVEEGDVFFVPRYHPMVQIGFGNQTFVMMGFSSSAKRNHPQFIAGKASVLRTLDRDIVASACGVNATVMDRILEAQNGSVILKCESCAEEEWRAMEEERRRRREEEEEKRRREEEEKQRREEEKRRREEEEKQRREEEKRREEEEKRKREEEKAAKQEEEKRRHEAEEEEEARREEEEKQRREEEEEAAKREEEKRRHEAEEEAAKREEEKRRHEAEEEEEARREEEERRRRWQEEAERARKKEEERRRQEEQEEAEKRGREEEEGEKGEEEQAAEEQRKWEEEMEREEEEAKRSRLLISS